MYGFRVVKTVVMRAKCAMVSASPSNCQLSPGRLPSWVRIIGVKALKSHQRSSSSLLRFISNRVV
jgi:hypothetical protein